MRLLVCLLAAAGALCAQSYDLLLKGGHVIDPRHDIDSPLDVAIRDGRVAALEPNIAPSEAKQTVDVRGLYVTPGLLDIHVHVYASTSEPGSYAGDNSVYPDDHAPRSCVTTVVDAGSSGWSNFPDFKETVIDRARTRVLAFVNIVGKGMRGGDIEQDLSDMDVIQTAAILEDFPETTVGVKTAHYAGPEWDPVDRAVEAAEMAGGVVMVDFGRFDPARPFEQLVLEHLRPGDIYTHTYLGRVPMFDANGKIRSYLFEAKKRGVKFDVGHGGGSFWWSQAVPATRQGFWPDSISTDLHISSMVGGMKDMTNVMSKFLNLGAPLEKVIRWSTTNPAEQIRRPELGHLAVGASADIAVLRLDRGRFGFLDVRNARLEGTEKLACELTLRDGRVLWDLNGVAGQPWELRYGRM